MSNWQTEEKIISKSVNIEHLLSDMCKQMQRVLFTKFGFKNYLYFYINRFKREAVLEKHGQINIIKIQSLLAIAEKKIVEMIRDNNISRNRAYLYRFAIAKRQQFTDEQIKRLVISKTLIKNISTLSVDWPDQMTSSSLIGHMARLLDHQVNLDKKLSPREVAQVHYAKFYEEIIIYDRLIRIFQSIASQAQNHAFSSRVILKNNRNMIDYIQSAETKKRIYHKTIDISTINGIIQNYCVDQLQLSMSSLKKSYNFYEILTQIVETKDHKVESIDPKILSEKLMILVKAIKNKRSIAFTSQTMILQLLVELHSDSENHVKQQVQMVEKCIKSVNS